MRSSPQAHCHYLIADTAKGMAAALFEEVMKDNARFKRWKELCPELTTENLRQRYVALAWPKLVEQARATLAGMLRAPGDESLKQTIADALMKDNALVRQRRAARFH